MVAGILVATTADAPGDAKPDSTLSTILVTPTISKHRFFVWLRHPILPDHQLIVFARDDDYFMGVLQSRLHEVWALAQGTQLREKNPASATHRRPALRRFHFRSWTTGRNNPKISKLN